MKTENQVTKLLDDANAIADMIADERAPEPDPDMDQFMETMEETSEKLVKHLQPMIDKYLSELKDPNMAGVIDALAMITCIVARGAADDTKGYFTGTKHLFDINLDHVDGMWQDHNKRH